MARVLEYDGVRLGFHGLEVYLLGFCVGMGERMRGERENERERRWKRKKRKREKMNFLVLIFLSYTVNHTHTLQLIKYHINSHISM